MTRILAISGSLRKGSFNTALMHAAVDQAPQGVRVEAATLHGIPLYDGDLESADGIPQAVAALKGRIRHADGVLLITPEYNNSLPGVFKNAIDWTTRPSSDIPLLYRGRPMAVIGASMGGFGTILSQNAWLPVLRTLGARPFFEGRLLVSRAQGVFDADGKLVDDKVRAQLADFIGAFAEFARTSARKDVRVA
ncbi:NAD(P)H-dependent oxidoreductase [Aureimonas sp. OT7]|uniref:NADPH-dependent FMN reductase n=1 Tax=Aureimonas TaxID=414371 RepID=UPI00178710BF|nr:MULTISPECIES: NADPH-dependent FMN reductase [Aureimonas]QOG05591.1 NAD(P)H-dependent oxidoreductase [Aureimonas sp. OT7]